MKTIVYVDGLNLYYGSLRGTPFKWLDLYALFRDCVLDVGAELEQVRYYTAPAKASSSDDPASPMRQQRYLHALKAHRGDRIQIIQGFIARTTPVLRLARPRTSAVGPAKVRVYQFTEKQTDVNLAADFISDACHDRCKQAVLCSNDRDLVGALTAVRRDHSDLVVGLVAPVRDPHHASRDLSKLDRKSTRLNSSHFSQSRMPSSA